VTGARPVWSLVTAELGTALRIVPQSAAGRLDDVRSAGGPDSAPPAGLLSLPKSSGGATRRQSCRS
jgi:hypothetical protein